MDKSYNQWRAMWGITRGSMKSILRSPSVIIFSIAFPLIFILVFGIIGGGSNLVQFKIVLHQGADTNNLAYQALLSDPNISFVTYENSSLQRNDLIKGKLDGVLNILPNSNLDSTGHKIVLQTTTASAPKTPVLMQLMQGVVDKASAIAYPNRPSVAFVAPAEVEEVRKYRTIDFILPGQLGFSLLSVGVFGVAFLFFNLRQLLVLKRFYATPIKRTYIILGEGFSRVIFQMLAAIVIVGLGYFAFNFTLIHGWVTFVEIMVLSFLALIVFMGFGFIVSSVAKNSSTIPPLANMITLPQFLLSGTFFSIDVFPSWIQPFCKVLPLTFFNDAMRSISFEGLHLYQVYPQLIGIMVWGLIIYAVATKVFKWE